MKNLLLAALFCLSGFGFTSTAEARRCANCGIIEVAERYVERGRDRGGHGGAIVGALIGAAVGSNIGSGDGRRAATVAGAIAGGAIGNNADKRRRGDRVVWEFRVRMDDGRRREYRQYDNPDRLQRGDRVIVRDGYVELY